MPKVSVNILTKNRSQLLRRALESVKNQSVYGLENVEVIVISDGSADKDSDRKIAQDLLAAGLNILFFAHDQSVGITQSRQEALEHSRGEYVAILDDDDYWLDRDKLKKQIDYLDAHPECVLAGGGIEVVSGKNKNLKFRPETHEEIYRSMLLQNNFFTSTVMFRREAAIKAGGFVTDSIDWVEDYDLWLRLGKLGKMYNFKEPFTAYAQPSYNKDKFKKFLVKQLYLIKRERNSYPFYWLAAFILKARLLF